MTKHEDISDIQDLWEETKAKVPPPGPVEEGEPHPVSKTERELLELAIAEEMAR